MTPPVAPKIAYIPHEAESGESPCEAAADDGDGCWDFFQYIPGVRMPSPSKSSSSESKSSEEPAVSEPQQPEPYKKIEPHQPESYVESKPKQPESYVESKAKQPASYVEPEQTYTRFGKLPGDEDLAPVQPPVVPPVINTGVTKEIQVQPSASTVEGV